MSDTTHGQARAKVGGERGANGEWYEGGKFIATVDRAKSSPAKWEPTAEQRAAWEARKAAEAAATARWEAWKAPRVERFKNLIDWLTACPCDVDPTVWARRVEDGAAGFESDLGRQLRNDGYLTERQAFFVCKFKFGRQNKKNQDAWYALQDELSERPPVS